MHILPSPSTSPKISKHTVLSRSGGLLNTSANFCVLLAKNKTGYLNLIKLVTKAHLEGFYYKPRIDKELLEKYHEGLIALTACLQGEIPKALMAEDWGLAKRTALEYQKLFGKDNFYLEIKLSSLFITNSFPQWGHFILPFQSFLGLY